MLSLVERSETAERGMGTYGEITNEKNPLVGRPRKRDADALSREMRPPKDPEQLWVDCRWDPKSKRGTSKICKKVKKEMKSRPRSRRAEHHCLVRQCSALPESRGCQPCCAHAGCCYGQVSDRGSR